MSQSFYSIPVESSSIVQPNNTRISIDQGQDFLPAEYIHIYAYIGSKTRDALFYSVCFVTVGIFPILGSWYPQWITQLRRVECSTFRDAHYVLIHGSDGIFVEKQIQSMDCLEKDSITTLLYFDYKKQRYIYDEQTCCFQRQNCHLHGTLSEFHQQSIKGLSKEHVLSLLSRHGSNAMDIESKSFIKMLVEKLIHPFYIFQMISILVWLYQEYTTYSLIILISSAISMLHEIYLAKKTTADLKRLLPPLEIACVLRDGCWNDIDAKNLVMGDIISLESTRNVPCDILLIQGTCIMDESSLTGESIPIIKSPLPCEPAAFYLEKYKSNVLFAGSSCIQVKPGMHGQDPLGIVFATGFSTSKGELFRSLLFPKPVDFKFYRDSFKFLAILGAVAMIAFINRVIQGVKTNSNFFDVFISSADLITIAVPPALPLVLTVGVALAVSRLKKLRIFCISPERINFAGRLDTMCWDKTGTLTSTEMKYSGCDSLKQVHDKHPLTIKTKELELIMSSCHGINLVKDSMVGHPIDIEMFQSSGWKMDQSTSSILHNNASIPIVAKFTLDSQDVRYCLKRFDFDSELQRSSAIILTFDEKVWLVCKGSAESIARICRPKSIPETLEMMNKSYALQGYYVLACALKRIDLLQVNSKRGDIEKDLDFAGFLLFRNQIKAESCKTMEQLKTAGMKNIIITGDQAMSAIHVSREIGILEECILIEKDVDLGLVCHVVPMEKELKHPIASRAALKNVRPFDDISSELLHMPETTKLAMTGEALSVISTLTDGTYLDWLMDKTAVFSRAKPNQKTWIIEKFISMNRIVGMCGDGTNDCGALKAAHVGIALSDAEASIVAPFTSCHKRVDDIILLVKEGRCALESSFTAFKYMTLYPIIQLMMAATLYQLGSVLSNNQYLFDDLALVLILGVFMCRTEPAMSLSLIRPPDDLFSPLVLASILGQVVVCILFFAVVYFVMKSESWFCSVTEATKEFNRQFVPLNASNNASLDALFPCYQFDPKGDIFNGNLAKTYENTILWEFTHFQFIWVAIAFTLTHHYRLAFWTNIPFSIYLVFSTLGLFALMLIGQGHPWFPLLSKTFSLVSIPFYFRILLSIIACINLMASLAWEYFFVDQVIRYREIQSATDSIDEEQGLIKEAQLLSREEQHHVQNSFDYIELEER